MADDQNVTTSLQALYAAQVAAESAFLTGEIEAKVVDEQNQREADVFLQWSREQSYIHATTKERVRRSDGSVVSSTRVVEQIYAPKAWIFFEPGIKLAQVVYDKQMSGWPLLRIAPSDIWFHMAPQTSRTWSQKLKIQLEANGPWVSTVRMLSHSEIEVTDTDKSTADKCITVYDLSKGGNVIAYETEPVSEANHRRMRGTYGWQDAGDGRFALKEMRYQMTLRGDKEYAKCPTYSIVVSRFDPSPIISPNRFQLSSLKLPSGTMVEEYGPVDRRYRIGGNSEAEPSISEEKFRELIEFGKEAGFGSLK